MGKETIKTIVIIVLAVILVIGVFYTMILPMYNQNIYNAGVEDGQMALIRNQMATGNIALIDGNGTLITKSIVEICGTVG